MHRDYIKKNVLRILKKHIGKENAIKANALYCLATAEYIIPAKASNQTRIIRSLIREIRKERELAVISGEPGYWIAENDEELNEFVNKQLNTARRMFGLAHTLSGIPIDRMVEQFKLNLIKEEHKSGQH